MEQFMEQFIALRRCVATNLPEPWNSDVHDVPTHRQTGPGEEARGR